MSGSTSLIKVVAGLGNPGPRYLSTRHNAGYWLVDAVAHQHGGRWKNEPKFQAEVCQVSIAGQQVWLIKPLTFMNHSGRAVSALLNYYRIPLDQLLVVHDELDLPPGMVKLKDGGGHGGHNGLRSLEQNLSGRGYHRLRIGIGHPGHKDQVVDYVLSRPPRKEQQDIEAALDDALRTMDDVVAGNMDRAMNFLHRR